MKWIIALAAACAAAPAQAEEPRDFCPDRPGLGTPPCTIDKGRVAFELGLADWTLEREGGERTDTFEFADSLIRFGLTDSLEAQIGWTAFGHVRERGPGGRSTDSGIGDVRVALRQNLANPDGSGFSAAVMPYATIPTGGSAIGAGDWSGGVLVPLSYELSKGLQLQFTAKAEAAADEDRDGRHLAYGAVAGLAVPLGETVDATFEFSATRDRDPAGHETELIGALSAGWLATPDFQIDAGANVGLNRAAPDVELYVGLARRF